ncbi:PREDICTED: cyclin-F [Condylura cristata]|uniref:cyclin-F n=1 Tax=Condylura cristata TaxID=143302 RepID=UPI0006437012|nr:PREDICTED: cyclin-F [Condylura cristata]
MDTLSAWAPTLERPACGWKDRRCRPPDGPCQDTGIPGAWFHPRLAPSPPERDLASRLRKPGVGAVPMVHCRCARCFCYPARRRVRRRPRNPSILSLPEDVLFHVLKWLPVGDLLAVRAVHSHLKYLVDNHASVWASASFQELWPSPRNLELFERAAAKGNFEAAVKLGIAYLYNEGLSVSDEARAEVNGLKASRFFSLAERLHAGASPFIWLFIRPPWSASGSCCKAVVHESLRAECQLQGVRRGPPGGRHRKWRCSPDLAGGAEAGQRRAAGRGADGLSPSQAHRASILHCLGRVLSLFEDEEKKRQARDLFEESANQGCLASAYLLWESDRTADVVDPGRSLHSFRKLRDFAAKGCWEAQVRGGAAGAAGRPAHPCPRAGAVLPLGGARARGPPLCCRSCPAAQPWPTRLWDLTGFSCDDLTPCVLSLHQKCFHDDAPKDYRQVSLTAVKQRFEDLRYGEISQEEVLSFGQLCAALGVKHESPEPVPFLSAGEMQPFLSSPSGRRSKRKRENGPHEDRGSFVATPTAELSSQEETLLGSFLDWSLDYCSGYEGDQESEGEKEGEVTAPSGVLDVTAVHPHPEQHCCQDSSDEEACPQHTGGPDSPASGVGAQTPPSPEPQPPPRCTEEPARDLTTSGYSSVSGSGSPLPPTSAPSPGRGSRTRPCHHHARKSCLQCRSPGSPGGRRRVKRKSLAPRGAEPEVPPSFLGL